MNDFAEINQGLGQQDPNPARLEMGWKRLEKMVRLAHVDRYIVDQRGCTIWFYLYGIYS